MLKRFIKIGNPKATIFICDKIVSIIPELIIFPYNLKDNETTEETSPITLNGNIKGVGFMYFFKNSNPLTFMPITNEKKTTVIERARVVLKEAVGEVKYGIKEIKFETKIYKNNVDITGKI